MYQGVYFQKFNQIFEWSSGDILVLFVVLGRAIFQGYFFKPLVELWYHFHNFRHFTELWVSFQRFAESWVPFWRQFCLRIGTKGYFS